MYLYVLLSKYNVNDDPGIFKSLLIELCFNNAFYVYDVDRN